MNKGMYVNDGIPYTTSLLYFFVVVVNCSFAHAQAHADALAVIFLSCTLHFLLHPIYCLLFSLYCLQTTRHKGQGSRWIEIGPVSKIDEIWLYHVCMSSVTENDFFKVWHLTQAFVTS